MSDSNSGMNKIACIPLGSLIERRNGYNYHLRVPAFVASELLVFDLDGRDTRVCGSSRGRSVNAPFDARD